MSDWLQLANAWDWDVMVHEKWLEYYCGFQPFVLVTIFEGYFSDISVENGKW